MNEAPGSSAAVEALPAGKGDRNFTTQHLAYGRGHREEDRALGMLAKIFGPDFSRELISTVLYPETFA